MFFPFITGLVGFKIWILVHRNAITWMLSQGHLHARVKHECLVPYSGCNREMFLCFIAKIVLAICIRFRTKSDPFELLRFAESSI